MDQKKVLLVEDEPLIGNLLKQRLEREGVTVQLARDGEEALQALQGAPPDLILLDVILPKISGFELMERIQADPQLAHAPIVVISNLGQDTDIAKGTSLGATAYIVKAKVSIDELVDTIKEFLASPGA